MQSISIVVPAYNEENNVVEAVRGIVRTARRLDLPHEIILVNDGSQDRTGTVARALCDEVSSLRLVEHYPNRGYGGALKAGFEAAENDLVAFVPADNQFNFEEIRLFLEQIADADVVCGYRAIRKDPWIRRMNALGWNWLVRVLFGYLCRDIDCGFKLFRREVLDSVHLISDGAMIDTEFLAGARARGFRVAEVPVTHLPRRAGRPTGANVRVIVRAFRDLLQFRARLTGELEQERLRQ